MTITTLLGRGFPDFSLTRRKGGNLSTDLPDAVHNFRGLIKHLITGLKPAITSQFEF